MQNRTNISSGAIWEEIVGYSRAVRIGNMIEISGTTAVDENGAIVGKDDLYLQTHFALAKALCALEAAGASVEAVIRTRLYVTDISQWQLAAQAHAEFFREVRPAATMVQVCALIDPALLVEVEISAVL